MDRLGSDGGGSGRTQAEASRLRTRSQLGIRLEVTTAIASNVQITTCTIGLVVKGFGLNSGCHLTLHYSCTEVGVKTLLIC